MGPYLVIYANETLLLPNARLSKNYVIDFHVGLLNVPVVHYCEGDYALAYRHQRSVQGGEGIRRLVEAREKDKKFLGLSVEYW